MAFHNLRNEIHNFKLLKRQADNRETSKREDLLSCIENRQEPVFGYPLMNFEVDESNPPSSDPFKRKKIVNVQYEEVERRNLWKMLCNFVFTPTPYASLQDEKLKLGDKEQ
jgi:hypothetical protein